MAGGDHRRDSSVGSRFVNRSVTRGGTRNDPVSELQIVNEAGESVVSLDHWMLGGRIDVRNTDGNRTTTIAQSDVGNGMVRVYSGGGHNLVYAGAGRDTDGGLIAVYTTSGETLVSAGSDDKGNGELEVYFRSGEVASVKP